MHAQGPESAPTSRDLWAWISLVPLGFGAWAPIVPGIRYRKRSWTAAGVFWLAMLVVAIALPGKGGNGPAATTAGGLLLLAWVGGIVTSFRIRHQRRRFGLAPSRAQPRGSEPLPSVRVGPPIVPLNDSEDPARPDWLAPNPGGAWVGAEPGVSTAPSMSAAPALTPSRDIWPWASLIPLGLGSWVPIIAAVRCRVWWWALPGLACVAATITGFVLAGDANRGASTNATESALAGALVFGSWFVGICFSFGIRGSYDTRRGLPPRTPIKWATPSARSRQWTARYAITAFVAAFVAIVLIGLLLSDVINVHVGVGAGVLIVDALLLLSILPLARRRGLAPKDLGLQPTRALPSLGLVVLALVLYFLVAVLWAVLFISSSTKHSANVVANVHHLSTLNVVVTVFAISLSAPIVEEIFFRGLLYRSLRNRLPVPVAALIAGACFGLAHILGYPLITLPIKAAFGVIACLLYERTGSLLPGIALHSFVDASVIDIALTGNDYVVLIVAGCLIVVILIRNVPWRSARFMFRSVPSFDAPPADRSSHEP